MFWVLSYLFVGFIAAVTLICIDQRSLLDIARRNMGGQVAMSELIALEALIAGTITLTWLPALLIWIVRRLWF